MKNKSKRIKIWLKNVTEEYLAREHNVKNAKRKDKSIDLLFICAQ